MENFSVFIAHHMGLFYSLSTILLALMLIEYLRAKRMQVMVGAKEAVVLINRNNAVIIDIRSHENYKSGHIVDAVSAPLQNGADATKKLDKYKKKPVIVVCNNGLESQKTASALAKQGYTAFALSGGMRAWSGADLPLVKE